MLPGNHNRKPVSFYTVIKKPKRKQNPKPTLRHAFETAIQLLLEWRAN